MDKSSFPGENTILYPWIIFSIIMLFGIILLKSDDFKQNISQKSTSILSLTPNPTITVKKRIFSIQEVSMHSSDNDCLIILKKKVYDATSFIKKIKGFLVTCGKDNTSLYETTLKQYPQYSQTIESALTQFEIGEIEE